MLICAAMLLCLCGCALNNDNDGDMIEVRIGAHVETGIITDCEGDNNRTVVYWKLRRV